MSNTDTREALAVVMSDPRFDALLTLADLADGEPRGEDDLTDSLAVAADVVAEVLSNVHGPSIAAILASAGFPPDLDATSSVCARCGDPMAAGLAMSSEAEYGAPRCRYCEDGA